jgi:hypothetical protein
VIFELRPPVGAGAPLTGTTGHDVVEVLRQLGVPLSLCRTRGSRPAWAVHRPSGLMICTYFDADDRLEAIEFGPPDSDDDAVTYRGHDVFTTPASDLITRLRRLTAVDEDETGHAFTAPGLLLALWRPVTPASQEDQEGRFFESVLLARPGYYDHPAEPDSPMRE